MLFGAEAEYGAFTLLGGLGASISLLVYVFKVMIPAIHDKHDSRLEKKDAECARERQEHREERQAENALNRESHAKLACAIDKLAERIQVKRSET